MLSYWHEQPKKQEMHVGAGSIIRAWIQHSIIAVDANKEFSRARTKMTISGLVPDTIQDEDKEMLVNLIESYNIRMKGYRLMLDGLVAYLGNVYCLSEFRANDDDVIGQELQRVLALMCAILGNQDATSLTQEIFDSFFSGALDAQFEPEYKQLLLRVIK